MPLTRVGGSTWNTVRNVYVDVLAELYGAEQEGIIFVSGGTKVNDGNGGIFKWEATAPRTSHDGINVIDPTNTGLGRGVWVRQKFFTNPDGTNFSEVQTATAGQTRFTLKTFLYTPGEQSLAIYVNGTRLTPDAFLETSSSEIELVSPLKAGDVVEFLGKERPVGGTAIQVQAFQVGYDPLTSGLVSQNVQRALDEVVTMIGTGGGGSGGGGAANAAQLAYAPLAPDTSATVQDGMHWIQNLIAGHRASNQAHRALDITYSNGQSRLNAIDVQNAVDEVVQKLKTLSAGQVLYAGGGFPGSTDVFMALEAAGQGIEDAKQDVLSHLSDSTAAHAATAISYTSPLLMFNGIYNVGGALTALADELRHHVHTAGTTTYNNVQSGLLSTNVKGALDEIFLALVQHRTMASNAHDTAAIAHTPINGMGGTTAHQAIIELFTNIEEHKNRAVAVHQATAIAFSGVSNGFVATDVQSAIVEAAGVASMPYKGHLDLTASAITLPTTQGRYTVEKAGAIDASWNAVIDNVPANGQVVAGDTLLYDGAKLYYLPNTQPGFQDLIEKNPAAANNQAIAVADVNQTGLTIESTQPGQTAAIFIVRGGDTILDNVISRGTVSDSVGNLRQTAVDVVYNNTLVVDPSGTVVNPNLGSTDVQHAIDELILKLLSHSLGGSPADQHQADSIIFQPITGVTATDVQAAIAEVQASLDAFKGSSGLIQAGSIAFDNTANGFLATDVQKAVEEIPRLPPFGDTGNVLAKLSPTTNDFGWVSEIDLGIF